MDSLFRKCYRIRMRVMQRNENASLLKCLNHLHVPRLCCPAYRQTCLLILLKIFGGTFKVLFKVFGGTFKVCYFI